MSNTAATKTSQHRSHPVLDEVHHPTVIEEAIKRNASVQLRIADHDFETQELELKTNTELTREIHTLTSGLHRRLISGKPTDDGAPPAAT